MWRRLQRLLSSLVPSLLLVLYIAVMVCFLNRWDSLVAVTLIPIWAWAAVGMILSLLSWLAFRGAPSLIIFTIWLATGVIGSEETHGLVRDLAHVIDPESPPEDDRRYRVVNVNAGESIEGLEPVATLEPDLVLVQRAPSRTRFHEWAREVIGADAAVLVANNQAIAGRGEILDRIAESGETAIHARIQLESGFLVDVTSMELEDCLPRASLWNPSTWARLQEAREQNRRTLRAHLGENQISQSSIGRVIAGGFQTPPGDDVFRPLQSNEMIDTFSDGGHGWGNTYPSELPLLRLDQIWASENLRTHSAETAPNPRSKHRLVVADLILPDP